MAPLKNANAINDYTWVNAVSVKHSEETSVLTACGYASLFLQGTRVSESDRIGLSKHLDAPL